MQSARTILAVLILAASLAACAAGNDSGPVAPYHAYNSAGYPGAHGGLGQAQKTD
jgi:hypothetical protein